MVHLYQYSVSTCRIIYGKLEPRNCWNVFGLANLSVTCQLKPWQRCCAFSGKLTVLVYFIRCAVGSTGWDLKYFLNIFASNMWLIQMLIAVVNPNSQGLLLAFLKR